MTSLRQHRPLRSFPFLVLIPQILTAFACVGPAAVHVRNGDDFMMQSNYDEAIAAFVNAIEADPKSTEAKQAYHHALHEAARHELRLASDAQAHGDRLIERLHLKKALSYLPDEHSIKEQYAVVEASIEADSHEYVRIAEMLLRSHGESTLGHATVLYSEAHYLQPHSGKIQHRFDLLLSRLKDAYPLAIQIDCESKIDRICSEAVSTVAMRFRILNRIMDRDQPLDPITTQPLILQIRVAEPEEQPNIVAGPTEKHSSYVSAHHPEVNPDYTLAAEEYQHALSVYSDSSALLSLRPGLISLLILNQASTKLKAATAILEATAPTISVPDYESYTYTEYAFSASIEIPIAIRLLDPYRNVAIFATTMRPAARVSNTVRVGLSPSDSNGVADPKAQPIPTPVLREQAVEESEEQIRTFLTENMTGLHGKLAELLIDDYPADAYEFEAKHAQLVGALQLRPVVLSPFLADRLLIHLPKRNYRFSKRGNFPAPSRSIPFLTDTEGPGIALKPTVASIADLIESMEDAVVFIEAGTKVGSGFYVGANGEIVTNNHVISGASNVVVHTRDGKFFLAEVLATRPERDLAILRIARSADFLALVDESDARVGTEVIAIGAPGGLRFTATRGIISQFRISEHFVLIQHDAAINPGSSGGPLIARNGAVVGVNTLKLAESEGLGFAVSSKDVLSVLAVVSGL